MTARSFTIPGVTRPRRRMAKNPWSAAEPAWRCTPCAGRTAGHFRLLQPERDGTVFAAPEVRGPSSIGASAAKRTNSDAATPCCSANLSVRSHSGSRNRIGRGMHDSAFPAAAGAVSGLLPSMRVFLSVTVSGQLRVVSGIPAPIRRLLSLQAPTETGDERLAHRSVDQGDPAVLRLPRKLHGNLRSIGSPVLSDRQISRAPNQGAPAETCDVGHAFAFSFAHGAMPLLHLSQAR